MYTLKSSHFFTQNNDFRLEFFSKFYGQFKKIFFKDNKLFFFGKL